MEIVRNEVFGPVLPMLTFRELDEAMELANDCDYGLTSSIYTLAFPCHGGREPPEVWRNLCEPRKLRRPSGASTPGVQVGHWQLPDSKHGLMEYLQTRVAYIQ